MKPKLYVGCSLSGAPDSFVQEIAEFKKLLKSNDYELLEFVGKVGGTNRDVYDWDINQCVRRCDAMIAICDLPSTGLGWELATALERRVPILAAAHQDATVSRLVLGAAELESSIDFMRYDQLNELIPAIQQMMSRFSSN